MNLRKDHSHIRMHCDAWIENTAKSFSGPRNNGPAAMLVAAMFPQRMSTLQWWMPRLENQ